MKQKFTVNKIVSGFAVLMKCRFTELSTEGQDNAIDAIKVLRPIAKGYDEFIEKIREKYNRKEVSGEALNKAIMKEVERVVEVDVTPLSADDLKKVFRDKENKLNGAEILALDDVMAEHKETAKK